MKKEEIVNVKLSRNALKDLKKVPLYIAIKLQAWVDDVGHRGLSNVRKTPGYHDEPLKGSLIGQRSIRLSRAYRAIYKIDKNKVVRFVEILEVNKHEY
jgi:proteic killer suppression protein